MSLVLIIVIALLTTGAEHSRLVSMPDSLPHVRTVLNRIPAPLFASLGAISPIGNGELASPRRCVRPSEPSSRLGRARREQDLGMRTQHAGSGHCVPGFVEHAANRHQCRIHATLRKAKQREPRWELTPHFVRLAITPSSSGPDSRVSPLPRSVTRSERLSGSWNIRLIGGCEGCTASARDSWVPRSS
jgi:hypothetical protein